MNKVIAVMPNHPVDLSLAGYLNFLASKISIDEVTNFHVFTSTYLFKHLNEGDKGYGKILLERIKEDIEKQLEGQFQNISNRKVAVVAGKNTSELLRKTHQSNTDLMVLGKHNDSDATIAKQVTRHISINTLVVPENAKQQLTHILVPVDLSEHSAKILNTAIQLKKTLGADVKITCYHSFETPNFPAYRILRTEHQFHEMAKQNNHDALHKFVEKHAGEYRSEIEEIVQDEITGKPDGSILEYAKNHDVDFLIMGTKGHSAIDAWLGSTVERVISKNDDIPMLIIK